MSMCAPVGSRPHSGPVMFAVAFQCTATLSSSATVVLHGQREVGERREQLGEVRAHAVRPDGVDLARRCAPRRPAPTAPPSPPRPAAPGRRSSPESADAQSKPRAAHSAATLPCRPVRKPTRSREVGRGEKVLPGIWRLRLPLPWPGVPHCNAWALAAGNGIVLVDTGMHEPGSMMHLHRALDQARLRIDHVRLIVCTHAHVDHCGQAPPIADRAGCEIWMHPNHAHHTASGRRPRADARPPRRGRAPERRPRGPAAALDRAAPRPGLGPGRASCTSRASSPTAPPSRPTSANGRSSRRPATRRRTSASTSPSAAC